MSRVAVDMDEVMADAIGSQLRWLADQEGLHLSRATLRGREMVDVVGPGPFARMEAMMHEGAIFRHMAVMPGCHAVMAELIEHHEVFVVSAAMDYPNSCAAKFAWLQEHFTAVLPSNIVFCGDKSIVQADFLLDDNARHFRRFVGTPLLFDAPHNAHVDGYERLVGWPAVASRLLGPTAQLAPASTAPQRRRLPS